MTDTEKLTSLSKQQIDLLPVIRDEWIAHGLSTKPANRKMANKYVDAAYKEAGLEPPKAKIWMESPLGGCIAVEMLLHLEKVLKDKPIEKHLEAFLAKKPKSDTTPTTKGVYERVIQCLRKPNVQKHLMDWTVGGSKEMAIIATKNPSLREIGVEAAEMASHGVDEAGRKVTILLRDFIEHEICINKDVIVKNAKRQVANAIYGQQDAGWLSFYDAMGRFGIEAAKRLLPLMKIAQSCGWWWAFEEVAIMTERPTSTHLDEEGRLHHEDEAAVAYPDGFAVYAVHGVRLPSYVITNPEKITVKGIRDERNAEIKRIMRERYGTGRYLKDIKAKVIHVDTTPVDALVPKGKCIHRALIEDNEENRYLVGSDGSTGRVYYMRVPSDVETCQAAYEALSGRSGVRTILEA